MVVNCHVLILVLLSRETLHYSTSPADQSPTNIILFYFLNLNALPKVQCILSTTASMVNLVGEQQTGYVQMFNVVRYLSTRQ